MNLNFDAMMKYSRSFSFCLVTALIGMFLCGMGIYRIFFISDTHYPPVDIFIIDESYGNNLYMFHDIHYEKYVVEYIQGPLLIKGDTVPLFPGYERQMP